MNYILTVNCMCAVPSHPFFPLFSLICPPPLDIYCYVN